MQDPVRKRWVTPRELAHLQSGRAKLSRNAHDQLDAHELVAFWRSRFHMVFDCEDLSLRTDSECARAAKTLLRATAKWGESRGKIHRFLQETLIWWGRMVAAEEPFPTGLPTIELVTRPRRSGGGASFYWGHWLVGGMSADLRKLESSGRA